MARAALTKRLADAVADELLNEPDRIRQKVERADICFILLQVRDDPVEQVPAHVARAMDIIVRRDGVVCDIMSSMVLAIFGLPLREDPDKSSDQRAKSVARLVTELGSDIRLVYGTAEGLAGTFGAPHRFHWGPLLPNFARYMSALTALEFGQSAEVRPI